MKVLFFVAMILSLVSADRSAQLYDDEVVRHVDGMVKAMQHEFSKSLDQEFGSDDQADKKPIGNSKFYGMYGYPGMYGYGGMYGMYGMYGYGGMYGMYGYPYYGYGGYYPYYGGFDGNPFTVWKRSTESSSDTEDLKKQIKAEFDNQVIKPFRMGALEIVQSEVDASEYSLKKRTDASSQTGVFAGLKGKFSNLWSKLKELFGGLITRFSDSSMVTKFNGLSTVKKSLVAASAVVSVVAVVFFFRRLFMKKASGEIDEVDE